MNLIPMNGHKVSSRELRRRLNAQAALLEQQAAPAINNLLHNDQVTQRKITALEQWRDHLESMTRWQRIKWLLGWEK